MPQHADVLNENKKNESNKITAANGAKISVTGYGDEKLTLGNGNVYVKVVMHVPDLAGNLLSVSQIVKNGNFDVFDSINNNKHFDTTIKMKGLFGVKTAVAFIALTMMMKNVFWLENKRVHSLSIEDWAMQIIR